MASIPDVLAQRVPANCGQSSVVSSLSSIASGIFANWRSPQATDSSGYPATDEVSTVCASTSSIASASDGRMAMPTKSKSRTITRKSPGRSELKAPQLVQRRLPTQCPPVSPGEMLLEEFLKPLGISQSAFAIRLGVSFPRLNEIVRERRAVTPDTALRLAQVTGMSADFWLGLQVDWDLWHALRSGRAEEIAKLTPLPGAG